MSHLNPVLRAVENATSADRLAEPAAAAVRRLTGPTGVKNLLSGTPLGHQIHPVLTDLPIGAWVAATFLDLTGGSRSADAAQRLVGAGVLAVVPTAATGASDWSETEGPER